MKKKEIEELAAVLKKAQYDYYNNGESDLTDSEYEVLLEKLKEVSPDNAVVTAIGAPDRDSVKLPLHMGSLEKKNTEESLMQALRGMKSEKVILSDKLDGLSALIELKKSGGIKMYTRGDGTKGRDISGIARHLNYGGKKLSTVIEGMKRNGIKYVRGEIIFPLSYIPGKTGEELRSKAVGIVNSTSPSVKDLNELNFVAYEICSTERCGKPSDQFDALEKAGFSTAVHSAVAKKKLNYSVMLETLIDRNNNERFGIDGIVVVEDIDYEKKNQKYPDNAFAFKSNILESRAKTKVVGIEWNVSRNRVIFPTVLIEPVKLGGSTVDRVSGKNAAFIQENGVGIGAELVVAMAGKVIPDIRQIRKTSDKIPLPKCKYEWNATRVNYIVVGDDCMEEVNASKLEHLFKNLPVDGYGESAAKKLSEGGVTDVLSLIRSADEDLNKIISSGSRLKRDTIQSIKNSDKATLAYACSMFAGGIGSKILEKVFTENPKNLREIRDIEGIGPKNGKNVRDGLKDFERLLKELEKEGITPKSKTGTHLQRKKIGIIVVFSGFRDKDLEKEIIEKGGSVGSSVTGSTTHVVTKEGTGESSKTQKARKMSIPILSKNDFKKVLDGF
ncbi:NAD-dependent DNA ligase [Tetraselmis virus 1]|uniref:DNA ligase (NAD(+)) n=1 Tax=Tetraselmis virus 1 TaxID=2060617 RepID=A0A2P0VP44_9VIRU|nr:NAD-dependent DNA ligase [Tetraselmis virus 1]AUF82675.1 NAD-dependent DNA ligase [Tetraselmis virus 1]